ncbi:MAG: hypothetical protein AB1558_06250, partial [Thermodesulfobacteriota bacterium]
TFLEAWSHGLPIVTTFDPDGLIAEHRLGIASTDAPGLAAGIRRLTGSPDEWGRFSARVRRYYVDNHTLEAVMPRFVDLFLDVLGHGGSRIATFAPSAGSP